MRIPEVIRPLIDCDPPEDPRVVAELFLGSAGHDEIVAVLAEAVTEWQRRRARATELRVFGSLRPASVPFMPSGQHSVRASLDALRPLFDTGFRLGNAQVATWGRATVQHHRQRLAMLYKQRDGLDRTIKRHEWAIEELERTGAPNLDALSRILDTEPEGVSA